MEQKITVRSNQTLFDIAFQETGSILAVLDLMKQNNRPLSDDLSAGQSITLAENEKNVDIKGYYKGESLHPATGITIPAVSGGGGGSGGEGIGYWAIEDDFIVSPNGIGDLEIELDFIVG